MDLKSEHASASFPWYDNPRWCDLYCYSTKSFFRSSYSSRYRFRWAKVFGSMVWSIATCIHEKQMLRSLPFSIYNRNRFLCPGWLAKPISCSQRSSGALVYSQPSIPWHSRIRPTLICYLSTVNLIWKLSFVWYMWTSNWHRSISISIKVSCLDSNSQTLLFVSSIRSCSCRGMWNKDSHSQASIERNASCLVSSLPLSFQSATSMINVAG